MSVCILIPFILASLTVTPSGSMENKQKQKRENEDQNAQAYKKDYSISENMTQLGHSNTIHSILT